MQTENKAATEATVLPPTFTIENQMDFNANNPNSNPDPSNISTTEVKPDPVIPPVIETPQEVQRDAALAKELGGVLFDKNGNLLDNAGRVLKAAAAVDQEIASKKTQVPPVPPVTEVKPEAQDAEVVLSIDKDGNVVDDKGAIVHAKGTYEYNEKTGEISVNETPIVNSLVESFKADGFQLIDEEGKPIQFDESIEGYKNLALVAAQEHANALVDDWLKTNQELVKLANHLATGKPAVDFYNQRVNTVDYNAVNIPETDKEGRIALVQEYLRKVNNMSDEDVKTFSQTIVDSGKLNDQYNKYLDGLKAYQVKKLADEDAAIQADLKVRQMKAEDYWNGVKKVVDTGKLHSVQLPETDRAKFYDYIASTVGNTGKSQYQLDFESMSPEQQLETQYIVYKRLNLDDVIKSRVKQEQADAIRARAQKSKPVIIQGQNGFTRSGDANNVGDLSISKLT